MKSNFTVLILTIGIPSAGKSTWVQEFINTFAPNQEDEDRDSSISVISTDQIRKELTGNEQCINPSQNPMIHYEAKKRAKQIIDRPYLENDNKIIIIDSTNVDIEEWKEYSKLGADLMIAKIFDTTPEQAIERMKNRERKVPMNIIQWKWDLLEKNRKELSHYFHIIINNLTINELKVILNFF